MQGTPFQIGDVRSLAEDSSDLCLQLLEPNNAANETRDENPTISAFNNLMETSDTINEVNSLSFMQEVSHNTTVEEEIRPDPNNQDQIEVDPCINILSSKEHQIRPPGHSVIDDCKDANNVVATSVQNYSENSEHTVSSNQCEQTGDQEMHNESVQSGIDRNDVVKCREINDKDSNRDTLNFDCQMQSENIQSPDIHSDASGEIEATLAFNYGVNQPDSVQIEFSECARVSDTIDHNIQNKYTTQDDVYNEAGLFAWDGVGQVVTVQCEAEVRMAVVV